jgi:hypothetical protein
MDLTTAAENVLALLAAEGTNLSDDLNEVERLVRETVQRVGAKAIEIQLTGKSLGYEGSSRACDTPGCRCDQRFVSYRPRTLATLLGQVTLQRAYYHCKRCGSSCCPYDRRVGLGPGQQSEGLAKAATMLAALDPFIPAAEVLHALTGQRLSDRTVHSVARRVGKVASEQERQLALRMAVWSVPIEAIEARPARLYVAVDGVFVRRQEWNEAKCITCYWEEGDGHGGVRRCARYAVRFESAEQFKAFAWSLACRCGLETATEVVLLGDGAAWIWEHIHGILGEQTVCITDWYHAMEHLWTCGKALHGEKTPETIAWVKERETLMYEGKHRTVLELLATERRQTRSLPKRRALRDLQTYLENQGERLNYARFRAAGYDIGSGRVESACNHVVKIRMKRSGMIWSEAGAQEILSLRTALKNGWWDALWATKPLTKEAA